MKNKKKKVLILVMLFSLLFNYMFELFMIANISYAATTTGTYQGMTYKIDETTQEVTITDFDDSVTTLTIPETIEGYSVIAIDNSAFEYSSLVSLKIPGTVKEMGNRAFSTGNLIEVEFLDGVTTIGARSFQACANLEKLIIPSSVTTIDSAAFSFCNNLKYVEIPKSVTVMYSAFNQSGLVEAVLEDGIETIPPHAFEECKSLTTIKIPESVTSIGEFAFSGCESLISLEIPSSVTNIETNAFYNFKNTLYVHEGSYAEKWAEENGVNYKTYPRSMSECTINKIYDKTYTGSEINPKVIVKDGEVRLKEEVDYTVSYSDNINIGTATITVTGKGNYTGTNSIQFNIVEETVGPETTTGTFNSFEYELMLETEEITITKYTASHSDIAIPKEINGYTVTKIGDKAFYYMTSLKNIEIPNTVTAIGEESFYQCVSLQSITIPDSVESIGMSAFAFCTDLKSATFGKGLKTIPTYAFNECASLEKIEIPDNVTSIEAAAFSDCTNLKNVNLGNGLKEIYMWAFRNCTGLTTLYIPENVDNIVENAFINCTGLTTIEVDENNSEYDSRENCNAIIRTSNNNLILGCINTVITNTVEGIGISAFYNCTSLTSIQIPDSVKSIGNSAFYGCSSLTSINLPDAVTDIGHSAFYDCRQLKSIEMPSSLTSIGAHAFYNCMGLTSIEIPDGLEYIGSYAFYTCSELTSIDIPDSVTLIGSHAFYNCLKLESVKLSSNITSIEDHTFLGCEVLTRIDIPDKVTKIGNNAFRVCNNLRSVTIPESVVEIEEDVFAYTHDDLTLTVVYGSYAEQYAIENSISYRYAGRQMQEFTNNIDNDTKISLKGVTDIGVELQTDNISETDDTFIEITDTIVDFDNYIVLGAYDINLVGGEYEGELSITFELGTENNEKQVEVWHRTSTGNIETYNNVVIDGKVTINVTELSPFILAYIDDTENNDHIKGDVNLDGNITLADYTKILAHVKKTQLLTGDALKAADVNGDGNVTLADYTKVLAHVKKTALLY